MGGFEDRDVPAGTLYAVKDNVKTGIVRPGFIFTGWNTQADGSGASHEPGDVITITGDVALYAQWTPEPPDFFGVTYLPNGGVGGFVDSGIASGSQYVIKSDTAAGVRWPFYDFIGWNTRADGSGISYLPGQVITVVTDLTLYAQWTFQLPTFTVTYHSNGGMGGSVDAGIPSDSQYVIKSDTAAGVSSPSSYYTFIGWNSRADGLGVCYFPGQVITATDNLILYAQWMWLA